MRRLYRERRAITLMGRPGERRRERLGSLSGRAVDEEDEADRRRAAGGKEDRYRDERRVRERALFIISPRESILREKAAVIASRRFSRARETRRPRFIGPLICNVNSRTKALAAPWKSPRVPSSNGAESRPTKEFGGREGELHLRSGSNMPLDRLRERI